MRPGFGPSHSGPLNGKTCKRASLGSVLCVVFCCCCSSMK